MKNISKISIKSIMAAIGSILVSSYIPAKAYGANQMAAGALAAHGNGQPLNLFGATGVFTAISNTAMFLVGALSVLMIVFGGLRYVTSTGDATKVTAAKNTVLYAIVGVVVAMLAYAAIDFVATTLVGGSITAGTNL